MQRLIRSGVLTGLLAILSAQAQTGLVISNITGRAGPVTLNWTAADTNYAFTVQSADRVAGGLWLNVPWESPWPTRLASWSDPRGATGTARYYRVLRVPAAQRGALLGSALQGSLTQAFLAMLAAQQGLPVTPVYGVTYYRLTYETIDPVGGRTQASGLLCVPNGNPSPLRLVSYQHGTLVEKTDAPSVNPTLSEGFVGIFLASVGYAVALPDYLGLGSGPGFHPYCHAASEATAAVDMLRATRAFCAGQGVVLTNRLFLIGYSQGGHATMALHRDLERYHRAEFTVTASAPMAGPYDLSETTANDFLSGRVMPSPYYFPYLLAAYQNVYHLTNSLSSLLAPPYSTTLPPLLDGLHSSTEINAAMPAVVTQILKPEVLAAFQAEPNHPLRLALRDNDVYDWTPASPMRLWHCLGDQDVVYGNSVTATNRFRARGVTVPLVDPNSAAGHGDCSIPSMLQAKAWFDTFP